MTPANSGVEADCIEHIELPQHEDEDCKPANVADGDVCLLGLVADFGLRARIVRNVSHDEKS